MQIRKATDEDIPQIISLLKVSLGDVVPKSENYWNWKHQNNPFGKSHVILAEENNQLIGVRAFMRWKWQDNNTQYSAVRAVDTATHPDFQGKGIFSKLTLSALEDIKADVNFVYNTPNEKSMPGYLKMGWIMQGRMPVKVNVNPFACMKKTLPVSTPDWNALNFSIFTKNRSQKIQTLYSPEYLKWRYADNPIVDYDYLTDGNSFLLIFRYKPHRFGMELRITDLLILPDQFSTSARKELTKQLKMKTKCVFLTTVSANQLSLSKKWGLTGGIIPSLNQGPIVTLRNLNLNNDLFQKIVPANIWAFSFGDMELF